MAHLKVKIRHIGKQNGGHPSWRRNSRNLKRIKNNLKQIEYECMEKLRIMLKLNKKY